MADVLYIILCLPFSADRHHSKAPNQKVQLDWVSRHIKCLILNAIYSCSAIYKTLILLKECQLREIIRDLFQPEKIAKKYRALRYSIPEGLKNRRNSFAEKPSAPTETGPEYIVCA